MVFLVMMTSFAANSIFYEQRMYLDEKIMNNNTITSRLITIYLFFDFMQDINTTVSGTKF